MSAGQFLAAFKNEQCAEVSGAGLSWSPQSQGPKSQNPLSQGLKS